MSAGPPYPLTGRRREIVAEELDGTAGGESISSIPSRPTEATRLGVLGRCCPTTRRRNCGPMRSC